MATAQLSAAPRPSAHPMANPGYGKKSAPDQEPRTGRDFVQLPAREASIAGYLDRLNDEADMSIKTLAKHLPYGQCAIGTALNNLSAAGHLRRVRRPVTVDGCPRWVWHTFFSRTARDDAWWSAFLAGEAPVTEPSRAAARSAAYGLLARLGRIDARLTLSSAECGALEEQAAEWFARGAGEARAARYEVVCTACGEPGDGGEMRGGLCGGCWGGRPGLAVDRVHARAGQVRAALRGGRSTGTTEKGARA
ncbi:hypothetical protein ACFWCA_15055 [Streptomyces phaeochromogenes]|uniref:hypothetical protein n=1 Tax=Streptomyces phaeochromogenes TaxID=1923 RepID=UPI0036B89CD9